MSDTYDPEFGTGANAAAVRESIDEIIEAITGRLGSELKDIVSVAKGPAGQWFNGRASERTLRLIRFGLLRSRDSL